MNTYYIMLIIKIAIAVLLAVVLGNGSVVWFNHMPARWYEDPFDGSLPEGLLDQGDGKRQRLTSSPWKFIFTAFFGAVGIYLALSASLQYEVAAIFVIFLVLEMAIADAKYRIVPDQLNILLAVSAIGWVGLQEPWWEPLAGGLVGLLLGLSVYGLGRLIYRQETIGGADLKFYLAIGLVTGRQGAIAIFLLIALIAVLDMARLALMKSLQRREKRPMLPYAFGAVTIYLLFLRDLLAMIPAL